MISHRARSDGLFKSLRQLGLESDRFFSGDEILDRVRESGGALYNGLSKGYVAAIMSSFVGTGLVERSGSNGGARYHVVSRE